MLKKFDYHIHTNFSDGSNSLEEVVKELVNLKVDYAGITDHFETISPHTVRASKEEYEREFFRIKKIYNPKGINLYIGAEVGISKEKLLIPNNMPKTDYIIASLHQMPKESKNMNEEDFWNCYKSTVENAVKNFDFDIIGHIEGYLPVGRFMDKDATFDDRRAKEKIFAKKYFNLDWYNNLSNIMKERNIAIEIHGGSGSPRKEVVELMVNKGVKLSFGTDAHAIFQLSKNRNYLELLEKELNLEQNMFINLKSIQEAR